MAEKEIAGRGGHGSREKARLRPEGDAGDHNDAGDGFEVGRKGEHHPAHRRQGGHHREDHQLSCLGPPGLKPKEKGQHQLHDDHGADEVIPPALDLGPQKQGGGDQHKKGQQGRQGGFSHGASS